MDKDVITCSGNGRSLSFACRADAKQAKLVGQRKAARIVEQSCHFCGFHFLGEKKSPWFGNRKGVGSPINGKQRAFRSALCPKKTRSRDQAQKYQKTRPVVLAFPSMLHYSTPYVINCDANTTLKFNRTSTSTVHHQTAQFLNYPWASNISNRSSVTAPTYFLPSQPPQRFAHTIVFRHQPRLLAGKLSDPKPDVTRMGQARVHQRAGQSVHDDTASVKDLLYCRIISLARHIEASTQENALWWFSYSGGWALPLSNRRSFTGRFARTRKPNVTPCRFTNPALLRSGFRYRENRRRTRCAGFVNDSKRAKTYSCWKKGPF